MAEHPTCSALLLCDQVLDDKRSHNKSYIGSFNAIYAQTLPCVHPRLCVLVSLTNLVRQHELTVTVRTPSDQKLFDATCPAEAPDPIQVVDLVFEIIGLPLSETGTYFVDAFCDGAHVGSRRFQVFIPAV